MQVGQAGKFPETKDNVWLAPRNVVSVPILASGDDGKSFESEQYIFYRGVANLASPINASKQDDQIRIQLDPEHSVKRNFDTIGPFWLVDSRIAATDGKSKIEIAYRKAASLDIEKNTDAMLPYQFQSKDYSGDNLQALKNEMRSELVNDGLFSDEATAMLATWENSYFRHAGTRVFFIVPKKWTNDHLPLDIAIRSDTPDVAPIAVEIERTMIGRIELYKWPSPYTTSQSQ